MIPEPQRTYLLELFNALGPAAQDFVVAGAQAMKFAVEKARGTRFRFSSQRGRLAQGATSALTDF